MEEKRSYIIIESLARDFERTSRILEDLKDRGVIIKIQREEHVPMYPSTSRYWLECVGGTTWRDIYDACKNEGIRLLF